MVLYLTTVSQFWSGWGLQIAVYTSFGAHLILTIFARSRRHSTCRLAMLVLWLAYQAAEVSAFYALGDLTLSGPDSASRQQQLIAFWAPLMLLHLGGPDNITAYALEDNMLSWRKLFEMIMQFFSTLFTLYNYIYLTDSGVLFPASILVAAAGVAKYLEKLCALFLGDLGKMKSSSSNTQSYHELNLFSVVGGDQGDNERALLNAHKLFPCCKRSMSDSSVGMERDATGYFPSEKIFTLGWEEMRTVVEMELSLMYDILYTKAAVIHTLYGYLVRLVSPLLTGAAAVLFCWFFPKHDLEPRDVRFTYIMLAAAFLLDVLWLVRALGSYWTYSYLRNPRSAAAWLLPHAVRHGEWCRQGWLHRVVACLDPCRWLFGKDRRSYRRWSGMAGRCNLLDECITRAAARGGKPSPRDWFKKEQQYLDSLFKCHQDVEEMLFERIRQRLLPLCKSSATGNKDYTMKQITTQWGHVALQKEGKKLFNENQKPTVGPEFQEDILVWHIGTSLFLWHLPSIKDQSKKPMDDNERRRLEEAIELVSEYLMFLVALRPHMLPGFVLRSLFEITCKFLGDVWEKEQGNGPPSYSTSGKEKLAQILYNKIKDTTLKEKADTRLLSDGIKLAHMLALGAEHLETLLNLIFDVWVDKLIYAGTKCSRESHAKQLSRGGELTTIVWMIVEHIGTFRIGEEKEKTASEKKKESEQKKKKEEEEKKPKDARPEPPPVQLAFPPEWWRPQYPEQPMAPAPAPAPPLPPPPRPRTTLRGEGFDDDESITFSTLSPVY